MQYPLVTIVGGSGFVGRHTVKLFADKGWRVRVLCRDAVAAEFLKTLGFPGQIVPEYADITQPATLTHGVRGSDAVVNLVSILSQSGTQRFAAVNVAGAAAAAQAAKEARCQAFVHVSALSVDRSAARYAKTKYAGEQAVREIFPQAIVLRPSLIIGPEDGFFQRFGRLHMIAPVLPLIGGGKTRFAPVLVTDVAQAIYRAVTQPSAAGKTFMLAGPQIYSFHRLLAMMLAITKRSTRLVPMPFPLASVLGMVAEMLPGAPVLTRDQVLLLRTDNVAPQGAPGFAELGMAASSIEPALPMFLARYIKE